MRAIDPRLARWFERIVGTGSASCLAGGSVVDFNLATDVDVWVPGPEFAAIVWTRVKAAASEVLVETGPNDLAGDYPGRRLGRAFVPAVGKPVDVMSWRSTDPEDLLWSFDLSVHMWAWRPDLGTGGIVGVSTEVDQPIKANCLINPRRSLQRYLKLRQRYRSPPSEAFGLLVEAAITQESLRHHVQEET